MGPAHGYAGGAFLRGGSRPALGFGAVPLYYPTAGAHSGPGAGAQGATRFGVPRGHATLNAHSVGRGAAGGAGALGPMAAQANRKWADYLAVAAVPPAQAAGGAKAGRASMGAGGVERAVVEQHEAWLRDFAAGGGNKGVPVVVGAAGAKGQGGAEPLYEVGATAPGAAGSQEAISAADFVIYITANKSKLASPAR